MLTGFGLTGLGVETPVYLLGHGLDDQRRIFREVKVWSSKIRRQCRERLLEMKSVLES